MNSVFKTLTKAIVLSMLASGVAFAEDLVAPVQKSPSVALETGEMAKIDLPTSRHGLEKAPAEIITLPDSPTENLPATDLNMDVENPHDGIIDHEQPMGVMDEHGEVHGDSLTDPHAEDGHGKSAGLPQMDTSWFASQIFWLLIVFGTLYAVMSKKILPALSSTIDTRRERIQSDLDSARQMKDEAERVHAAYDKALHDSRQKASEKFTKLEESIKAKTSQKMDELQEKAMKEIQESEARFTANKAEAMKEMDVIAAEIAALAAEKIAGIPANLKQATSVVKDINKKAA